MSYPNDMCARGSSPLARWGGLFVKELKKVIFSVVFPLTAAGIILFVYSQDVLPGASDITKPLPNGDYGMKASNDPALIMPEAAKELYRQYESNTYITYPNGFYKSVKLNQDDRETMRGIVDELSLGEIPRGEEETTVEAGSGISITMTGDEMSLNEDGSYQITMSGSDEEQEELGEAFVFELDPAITEERFNELMTQADALLGGGSSFSTTWINLNFGEIPVTYEEALADYELMLTHDKYTGAHARLFSDYLGIALAILPVFPAVFLCLRDRKRIAPLLQTRRVSSMRLITARYAALVTAVMLPVLVISAALTYVHGSAYGFENSDMLAYFKYALGWQLPIVMVVTALGMFLTTLTGTPVAIAVQLVWWFTDMTGDAGTYVFQGVGAWKLVPRHNSLGKTELFLDYFPSLVNNRIMFSLIALALVALTAAAYEAKRRGMLGNVQRKI